MKAFFSVFIAAVCAVILSGCASKWNPLCQAIVDDDADKVRTLIKKGADVNDMNCSPALKSGGWEGAHPLMLATNRDGVHATEIVKLLINNGANAKYKTDLGSPLFNAINTNNIETVKLLIRDGADVNQMDTLGYTPLGTARLLRRNNIAKILIENGGTALSEDERVRYVKERLRRYEEARMEQERQAYEQKQRDKAESREMWGAAATLGTGVAVGHATRNLAPDQQERMMRSSMNSVQSGDASEFVATTQQVKAERTQEHNAKMQAIEAQKEREGYDAKEAEAANNRRMMDASIRSHQPSAQNTTNRQQPPAQSWNNQAQGNSGTSQQDQERQRRELQAQLAANQQGRNRNEEQLQQQAQQNGRGRNNTDITSKHADEKNNKQAQDQYLSNVASSTRLSAITCLGGEGKYYASGSRPKIKPELVSCVDIHFRAYCPGDSQGISGIIHNFTVWGGCSGETAEINPKPQCKVKEVRVVVVEARGCGS